MGQGGSSLGKLSKRITGKTFKKFENGVEDNDFKELLKSVEEFQKEFTELKQTNMNELISNQGVVKAEQLINHLNELMNKIDKEIDKLTDMQESIVIVDIRTLIKNVQNTLTSRKKTINTVASKFKAEQARAAATAIGVSNARMSAKANASNGPTSSQAAYRAANGKTLPPKKKSTTKKNLRKIKGKNFTK